MELDKSDIQNIRNQANRRGIKPTSEQIRQAIAECYPDGGDFDSAMIPSVVNILEAQLGSKEDSALATQKSEQIALSEEEKQAVIAEIAHGAGIELKAVDVKQITVSIASTFASRKELNEAIFSALVQFAEQFKNQEVSKMRRKANQIRQTLAEMDEVAGSELTQIKQAMEATALDYKSQLAVISLSFAGIIDQASK